MDILVCSLCDNLRNEEEHNQISIDNFEVGKQINIIFRGFICKNCLSKFIVVKNDIIKEKESIRKLTLNLDTGKEKDKGINKK